MSVATISPPSSIQRNIETAQSSTEQDISRNPSQQDIANLAYALWQQRGCPEGSADEDWKEAERQLITVSGGA
jgi:DUF2934 family protein